MGPCGDSMSQRTKGGGSFVDPYGFIKPGGSRTVSSPHSSRRPAPHATMRLGPARRR